MGVGAVRAGEGFVFLVGIGFGEGGVAEGLEGLGFGGGWFVAVVDVVEGVACLVGGLSGVKSAELGGGCEGSLAGAVVSVVMLW